MARAAWAPDLWRSATIWWTWLNADQARSIRLDELNIHVKNFPDLDPSVVSWEVARIIWYSNYQNMDTDELNERLAIFQKELELAHPLVKPIIQDEVNRIKGALKYANMLAGNDESFV